MQWLAPLIKEIWFHLLSFEVIIGGSVNMLDEVQPSETSKSSARPVIPSKLIDLKFLIQLE